MVTLKRIGVLSMAKLEAVILAVMGLLQGLVVALFGAIGAMFGAAAGDISGLGLGAFGIFAIILFPIFWGVGGFIFGAITAFIYNLIAGAVGGLEIELEQ